MKLILAISALAAFVAAQDLNSLPDCGKLCVNNMLAKSAELGCAQGDTKCYCTNPNFGNGLKDCSLQACGAAVQSQVVSFGQAYCSSITASGGAAKTTTGASGSSSSGSTTTTTTGASGASASASSAISSAQSSASSAVSSVSSSANAAASSAASKASSNGAASSSSSAGLAMKTQAPLAAAGILGIAALLV